MIISKMGAITRSLIGNRLPMSLKSNLNIKSIIDNRLKLANDHYKLGHKEETKNYLRGIKTYIDAVIAKIDSGGL